MRSALASSGTGKKRPLHSRRFCISSKLSQTVHVEQRMDTLAIPRLRRALPWHSPWHCPERRRGSAGIDMELGRWRASTCLRALVHVLATGKNTMRYSCDSTAVTRRDVSSRVQPVGGMISVQASAWDTPYL